MLSGNLLKLVYRLHILIIVPKCLGKYIKLAILKILLIKEPISQAVKELNFYFNFNQPVFNAETIAFSNLPHLKHKLCQIHFLQKRKILKNKHGLNNILYIAML